MHYGPFKFVLLLFTPSRIFNDQNVLHDSLNLFRYIWHHLVQSEQNCLWWLFFKSVPLLFTIHSIFGDKIVHDVSSKTVPLLFTPSNIFWKKSFTMVFQICPFIHSLNQFKAKLCKQCHSNILSPFCILLNIL